MVCPYPSYTTFKGETVCDGFNMLFNETNLLAIVAVLFAIFIFTVMQAKDKKFAAVIIFLLPVIDVSMCLRMCSFMFDPYDYGLFSFFALRSSPTQRTGRQQVNTQTEAENTNIHSPLRTLACSFTNRILQTMAS